MKKLLFAVICAFGLAGCLDEGTTSVTSSAGIDAPQYFIADTLGPRCTRDNQGAVASVSAVTRAATQLSDNSLRYISDLRRSTSLTVNKDAYAAHWQPFLFASYAAAASGDQALARSVIDGIGLLARNQRYTNEPGLLSRDQALQMPPCYAAGPNSPCATHTPRFVARMYANLIVSAAVTRSFMTDEDAALIVPWLSQGYRRFVVPELNADADGIYDFANMGLTRLAFAALTNDMRLAQRELSDRRRDFIRRINTDGYIDQNSYRGVRGFWYHTYGLDPVLSYALVAREWGVDYFRDPVLGPRLAAAVDKTRLGILDYDAFRSVGNRGTALSMDPADEIRHVHQLALNLYQISAREFGVNLPNSPRFTELSRIERYSQISGLMANCYYSGR